MLQATGAIVLNRADVIAVHYCQQIGPATPSRSTPLSRAYSRVVGIMNRTVERSCYRANRTAVFACVSEGVAAEMREHFPDARERIVAIQNGVDTELFAPGRRAGEAAALRATLGISSEQLVAAFVGGEWERKGLAALIGALATAPAWEVLVAGGGDEERYRALARSLGVEQRVHLLGVTRDVQLVYQLADALVFPSSYEAFSLVTLEAAASGLPILATPVSGVRELIEDGRSGFLISQEPSVIGERLQLLASRCAAAAGDGPRRTRVRAGLQLGADGHPPRAALRAAGRRTGRLAIAQLRPGARRAAAAAASPRAGRWPRAR